MGVVNLTPDSFSDGGRYLEPAQALERALTLDAEGAAILDLGGESTRPGAAPVTEQEEIRRVLPVLERLRPRTRAILSIDTSKPEVMRAAAAAGVDLINDVYALRAPGALEAAAASGCAVCLMHMQGEPRTMQHAPHYDDVVGEVRAFLAERVSACRAAGIADARIVLDPGFGFGKTLEHNLTLLRRLEALRIEGLPLLAGLSRKSMIGALTGKPSEARVHGSVAAALIAAQNGARILRVHDVAATVDALKVLTAVTDGSAGG
ncbi:MAG: dihydropteroate synthase [Gammaproteobacteria bacterium]|nr:dihydropteroate synthase [Gammaproteobacteria bacterium]